MAKLFQKLMQGNYKFIKALGCEDTKDEAILFYKNKKMPGDYLYVFLDSNNNFNLYTNGGDCIRHATLKQINNRLLVLSESEFGAYIDQAYQEAPAYSPQPNINLLSKQTGIPYNTLYNRIIAREWPAEKAIMTSTKSSLRKHQNLSIQNFSKAIIEATFDFASQQLRSAA